MMCAPPPNASRRGLEQVSAHSKPHRPLSWKISVYMTGTSAVHQVIAHRAIPGSMSLADIVTALCLRMGLTEDDLDVSELTDGVRGYALAR
jgi:hypothetical protein